MIESKLSRSVMIEFNISRSDWVALQIPQNKQETPLEQAVMVEWVKYRTLIQETGVGILLQTYYTLHIALLHTGLGLETNK